MAETISRITNSPASTKALGRSVGQYLKTSAVIMLTGDLGSGKTVFVQGLAAGIGVPETYYITSPSYTLINEYPGRIALYHVDLYRLESITDFEEIGLHDIFDGDGVVAVEWAEKLDGVSFTEQLQVRIEAGDDDSRKITLTAYGLEMDNLIESLGHLTVS